MRKFLWTTHEACHRLIEGVGHTCRHLREEAARVAEQLDREEELVKLRDHLFLVGRANRGGERPRTREAIVEHKRLAQVGGADRGRWVSGAAAAQGECVGVEAVPRLSLSLRGARSIFESMVETT